jgi:hypothetical protein
MTLPGPNAARPYAQLTGCLFLGLGFLSATFFAGLAYLGIDARAFMVLPLVVGALGLLLLVARGLGVLLPLAVLVGFSSVAFWAFAWATSQGLDAAPALPILPALLGGIAALRGWTLLRRGRKLDRPG